MVQCSDGSEKDENARAAWSRKASWRRRRAFTWALGDWRIQCGRAEVLLAMLMTMASHEWRQERTKWYLREIM